MEIRLQEIPIPNNGTINKHVFSTYDPVVDFTEEKNFYYLQEDLLHVTFHGLGITVDLGWYGDLSTNEGEFKVFVIKGYDWENPLKIVSSTSQKEITKELVKILWEVGAQSVVDNTAK